MRDLLAPEGVATLVVGPLVLAAVGLAVLSAPVIGKSPPDRTAVVDRLGDDYAVLLVEADGEIAEQRVVDPSIVPNGGRYEGAVLDIDGGGYTYNETATDGRERNALPSVRRPRWATRRPHAGRSRSGDRPVTSGRRP
jgi:hypothetical protein